MTERVERWSEAIQITLRHAPAVQRMLDLAKVPTGQATVLQLPRDAITDPDGDIVAFRMTGRGGQALLPGQPTTLPNRPSPCSRLWAKLPGPSHRVACTRCSGSGSRDHGLLHIHEPAPFVNTTRAGPIARGPGCSVRLRR